MGNILLIFGSNSHVLDGFYPDKKYTEIIIANRSSSTNKNFKTRFISYDLLCKNENENKKIIDFLNSNKFDNLDVLYASYTKKGLQHTDTPENICDGLFANVARPLSLFSLLSEKFVNKKINAIFISSIYSITSPNPKNYTSKKQKGNVSYGVEKVSINRLIKYYAAELGKYNITINNIIPGAFPNDNVIKKYPKFIKNLKNSTVINKIGRPHDLNTLMLFLSSKYTRFITGSDIVIDGGWTII